MDSNKIITQSKFKPHFTLFVDLCRLSNLCGYCANCLFYPPWGKVDRLILKKWEVLFIAVTQDILFIHDSSTDFSSDVFRCDEETIRGTLGIDKFEAPTKLLSIKPVVQKEA